MKTALVKDMSIYGGGEFLLKIIGFATLPIFAHIFSVSEFGLIELILTIAGLIGIFLNLGLNNAVQRFYFDPGVPEKDRPSIVSSGLWILCGWSILFTLAVCTISFILNDTLLTKYEIPLSLLLIALLTNIPSQILQYCLDVLRLHFAPVAYSCLSILKNISGIILQLLLVVPFSLGVFGYFFGAFIALILIIPVGFWVIKKDLHLAFERSYGEILIAYGYPFVFAGMAYWIFGTIDRLMLTGMTDLTQVGLYSIAFKFSTILTFVNSAFGQAWSPYVIKLYREEINYRQIISQIFSIWFFSLTVIGLGLIFFSKELLIITTPQEYWPAASTLAMLTIGLILLGTTQITVFGISIEKKTYILSWIAWITAGLNIGFNYLFIPSMGALGSAIATTITYAFLTGAYFYWSQKLHAIPFEYNKMCMILFILICSSIIGIIINSMVLSPLIILGKIIILLLIIIIGYQLKLIPDEFIDTMKIIIHGILQKMKI